MEVRQIADLRPYDKNPRKNDAAVDAVVESIKQCGYVAPIIVDEDNVILAGHTRYKALKKLGRSEVECIVREGLTEEQKKKYRLLDNKTNELADWDLSLLAEELEELDFGELDLDWGLPGDKDAADEIEGEVPFTDVLREEHNYIVLYFDNEVDWLQAESIFDLRTVQALSTRKDGKITKSGKRRGLGRVLKGAEALEAVRNAYQC